MYQRTVNNTARTPHNPFTNAGAESIATTTESQQEAVVVDCIINDTHPLYAPDGYNVGSVQFRYIKSNMYRDVTTLNWAFPEDANLSEYPLLNEVIIVKSALNRLYYSQKLNITNTPVAQPLFGLNEELSPPDRPEARAGALQSSVANPKKVRGVEQKVGKYFNILPNMSRLRHDEGDIIMEGRSGHSIRFGAAWKANSLFKAGETDQSPNILIRVGPRPAPTAAPLSQENINTDASSIWVVADQNVPLDLATAKATVHLKSISNYPAQLTGAQIVINSDRIILNSKRNKILGFAQDGIHWTSATDYSVDVEKDHTQLVGKNKFLDVQENNSSYTAKRSIVRVGESHELHIGKIGTIKAVTNVSVQSPKIYLGTENSEEQPLVLGELLADFLQKFIDIHIKGAPSYIFPPPSGKLNQTIVTALGQLKKDVAKGPLASFNSKTIYGTMTGNTPSTPPSTSK
jgi:hypothetical protein